ncbi:translation elongation factor 2 [Blastocladiella emersonii ATCC 22665]|nr:translation elongation factor 2 [Blastocladiella emersonii ATCC 22665]
MESNEAPPFVLAHGLDPVTDGPLVDYVARFPTSPESVRNVALVGAPSAGKSALAQHLLGHALGPATDAAAAAPPHGPTARMTSYPIIDTAADRLVYLVDTPGDVNLGIDVASAMSVADGAVVVVDPLMPPSNNEALLVRYVADQARPVVVLVNKLDLVLRDASLSDDDVHALLRDAVRRASPDGKPAAVLFGSVTEDWAVRDLGAFADRVGITLPTADPLDLLLGEHYLDPATSICFAEPFSADGRDLVHGFVTCVVDPLRKLYSMDHRAAPFLPLSDALMSAIFHHVSAPNAAQLEYAPTPDLVAVHPAPYELVATAVAACSPGVPGNEEEAVPLVMSNTRAYADFCLLDLDPRCFLFGRVYSGTLAENAWCLVGDTAVRRAAGVPAGHLALRLDAQVPAVMHDKSTFAPTLRGAEVALSLPIPVVPHTAFLPVPATPLDGAAGTQLQSILNRLAVLHPALASASDWNQLLAAPSASMLLGAVAACRRAYPAAFFKLEAGVRGTLRPVFRESVTRKSDLVASCVSPHKRFRVYAVAEPLAEADESTYFRPLPTAATKLHSPVDPSAARPHTLPRRAPSAVVRAVDASPSGLRAACPANPTNVPRGLASGFAWVRAQGPVLEMPVHGVRLRVLDAHDAAPAWRGVSSLGQIVPTARRVAMAAILAAGPVVLEPVVVVETSVGRKVGRGQVAVARRAVERVVEGMGGGEVSVNSSAAAGTVIRARVPLRGLHARGLDEAALCAQLAAAIPPGTWSAPVATFGGWSRVTGDPLDATTAAGQLVRDLRRVLMLRDEGLDQQRFLSDY